MPWIPKKTKKVKAKVTKYQHNKQGSKYYNSVMWRNLRTRYINSHPFCEECIKDENGQTIRFASEVHHKIPFLQGKTEDERWQLLLDPDNLMSVCGECHHRLHGEKLHTQQIPPLCLTPKMNLQNPAFNQLHTNGNKKDLWKSGT